MHYSTRLLITQKRLTEWGHWCYHIVTMGLGYSSQSLIAKVHDEEGVIIQGTAKQLVPTNDMAEEVNALVEQLATQKPKGQGKPEWAKVIRIHYTMQEKTIQEKVQVADLPKSTYYRYLQDAQYWLSQYLTCH